MSDEDSPLPAIGPSLDALTSSARDALYAAVDARDIHYPFGSGQGDELALRCGLRPLIRELLNDREIEQAIRRHQAAGFVCEIAPRRYGPTHDGWDDTPDPSHIDPSQLRRALFTGRDRQRLVDAVACDDAKTDEADRELGRLLGYPRCCVEAFVSSSSQRKNVSLIERAIGNTQGLALARLNVLDLAVFHYISWYPCSYRCEWSARYANALADRIRRVAPAFVTHIDRALSKHRLVLHDDVQLSLEGTRNHDTLSYSSVQPTSRDRHPHASLSTPSRDAVARALAVLQQAKTLRLETRALVVDTHPYALESQPVLISFEHSTTS
ncbi:MAG: DUF483 domain-containing protein [Polyangiaceae bacterium]